MTSEQTELAAWSRGFSSIGLDCQEGFPNTLSSADYFLESTNENFNFMYQEKCSLMYKKLALV